MASSEFDSILVRGEATFIGATQFLGSIGTLPAASVNDAAIATAANLDADKLENRISKTVVQAPGTDVVNGTTYIFVARAAGVIKSLRVRPLTAPTGGDKAFTVDLKRAANASGSFTSLLSSVVTVNSSSVDQTVQNGTLTGSPNILAGDLLQIVIAVSGSTGSQGQGVVVEVEIDEVGY